MNDETNAATEPNETRSHHGDEISHTLVHSGPAPKPEVIQILPMSETVLFPELVMPVVIDQPGAIASAQHATRNKQPVGLLLAVAALLLATAWSSRNLNAFGFGVGWMLESLPGVCPLST